jgi:probable rRNA maturation factor
MVFDISILIEHLAWQNALENIEETCENTLIAASKFIDNMPKHTGVAVLLTSDEEIRQLNKQFRHKDSATNVLSFPNDSDDYIGDMAMAWQTINKEAQAQDKSLIDHIKHLLIHGFLHLLGYDHIKDDEAEAMESLEIKILASMKINNPYILENR